MISPSPPSRTPLFRNRPPRSVPRLAAPVVVAVFGLLAAVCAWAQPQAGIPRVAPEDAPSKVTLTDGDEPGDPLVVHGTVVGPEGEPVPGASVFVYQTGADGIYGPKGNRDPRLRGYLRTDGDGRFELRTIKPGSYPGTSIAAHIHIHVAPPGGDETVGEIVFEGDPHLTDRMRRNDFFTVVELREGSGGTLEVDYRMKLDG